MPRRYRPPKPKTAHPINIYACLDLETYQALSQQSRQNRRARHLQGTQALHR
jgi:hypothetical protein